MLSCPGSPDLCTTPFIHNVTFCFVFQAFRESKILRSLWPWTCPSHSHELYIYSAFREFLQINMHLASIMSCLEFGGQRSRIEWHSSLFSVPSIFQDIECSEAEADGAGTTMAICTAQAESDDPDGPGGRFADVSVVLEGVEVLTCLCSIEVRKHFSCSIYSSRWLGWRATLPAEYCVWLKSRGLL